MLFIYNVFCRKHTFVHTKPKFRCWIHLKKIIAFMKHSAAIFILQTSRSLSTSEMEKLLCRNTLRFTLFAHIDNILQKESLQNRVGMKIQTYTRTHTHTSWQWTLIWDHDKHAADGACRERVRGRETDRETDRQTESHIKSFPCSQIHPSVLWTRLA